MAYEDFTRQRDYPISQYERMAGILRGIPVEPNVEDSALLRTIRRNKLWVQASLRWGFIRG
jgi:hypothetical protein